MGANEFLNKPIRSDELKRALTKVLTKHEDGDAQDELQKEIVIVDSDSFSSGIMKNWLQNNAQISCIQLLTLDQVFDPSK